MKIFYITTILLTTLLFSGCSNKTLDAPNLKPSNITLEEMKQGNISVELEKEIYSQNETISFTLKNNTDQEYYYGVDFTLEVQLDNNCWYEVPFDNQIAFIEIAKILSSNSTSIENIDLSLGFSSLDNGNYRIVKRLHSDGMLTTVTVPFIIDAIK